MPESPEGSAGVANPAAIVHPARLANPAGLVSAAASDGRGWRRTLLAACAAVVAAVALGFPASGCLNPRPEELPSTQFAAPGDEPSPTNPVRETCEDNPLLAECSLPPTDINDDPLNPPASQTPDNLYGQGTPAPEPAAGTEMAGAAGGGGGDAGTDVPADAGAP